VSSHREVQSVLERVLEKRCVLTIPSNTHGILICILIKIPG
jgi:hypothetical protein